MESSFAATRTRHIACVACRQNKSRCEKGEGPCVRCSRNGLLCREDPRFQRMSKSRKLEELEKQVQYFMTQSRNGIADNNFLGTMEQDNSDIFQGMSFEQFPDHPISDTLSFYTQQNGIVELQPPGPRKPDSDHDHSPRFPGSAQTTPASYHAGPLRALASTYRRLGILELSKIQIDSLFGIFFDHYHPYLPFLNPSQSPDLYFDQSPLLFWAIISVASRRYEQDVTLLRFISPATTALAWETISKLPNHLLTVQALLILCTWPFPTSSSWTEPTPIWTSIAITASQHLGLHRPQDPGEFMRVKPSPDVALQDERLRTWAACSIVAQNTTASFGHLPSSLYRLAVPATVEEEYIQRLSYDLQQQLAIQKFCSKVGMMLFEVPSLETEPPDVHVMDRLIPLLEAELLRLEESFGALSKVNAIHLLCARLFLDVHHFYTPISSETRMQGILKAYETAKSFISSAATADPTFAFYSNITSYLLRMLFTAVCVLWKVLSSSYRAHVSFEDGKAHFNQGISALRKCSTENNDTAGRQAEILVQLWYGREMDADARKSGSPTLKYNNRYSASLAYDCLFYWRDHIGGQTVNGLHTSTTIPVDGIRETSTSLSSFAESTFNNAIMNEL